MRFLKKLVVFVWLALLACARSGQPETSAVRNVEADTTLTHAVLILENPNFHALSVRLVRPGLDRSFVVPPRASVRQLVPAGVLDVVFGAKRMRLSVREKTRSTVWLFLSQDKNR